MLMEIGKLQTVTEIANLTHIRFIFVVPTIFALRTPPSIVVIFT